MTASERRAVLRARAHDAMRAIRLTCRTLRDFWLPALDRLDDPDGSAGAG